MAKKSSEAKRRALSGICISPVHAINFPRLKPELLMPQLKRNGLRCLSLFSGGGGLDMGFDRAGFDHVASYEILTAAGQTLSANRPHWKVFSGDIGNVSNVDWRSYSESVDVIHGGPPCQPFSSAGRQLGHKDERNLFPEFIRAVLEIKPTVFLAENVRALANNKFKGFVQEFILKPLSQEYRILTFNLGASSFGVPQVRTRVFFLGLRKDKPLNYNPPEPTHYYDHSGTGHRDKPSLLRLMEASSLERCMGAREALGLPDIGFDALAPTIRSGLTGPRHTTSILSSVSALKRWHQLQIWPNGVAKGRQEASKFVPDNEHFRLSVPDCALLQGFPASWCFSGAVYLAIGQIGNSVAPPVAYHLALSILKAFCSSA